MCAFHYLQPFFFISFFKDTKCELTFNSQYWTLNVPTWQRSLKIEKEHNGLYSFIQSQLIRHHTHVVHSTQIVSCSDAVSKALVWHHRLGHVPSLILQLLPIEGLHVELPPCDIFLLAKKPRHKFSLRKSVSANTFDLVYINLLGPYMHKTHNNFLIFLKILEINPNLLGFFCCMINLWWDQILKSLWPMLRLSSLLLLKWFNQTMVQNFWAKI